MNTKKFLPAIQKFLLIIIGNTIYASAVVMFLLPNNLMSGGTTGLGLFFQHQFHIPIAYFVGVFNVIMFLLGAWILGKTFAMTTLVSTFYYPICLDFLQRIPFLQNMTDDTLLAILFSGLMIGFGTVSYTHLDVYKRQESSTVPLIIQPLATRLFLTTAPGLYFAGGRSSILE